MTDIRSVFVLIILSLPLLALFSIYTFKVKSERWVTKITRSCLISQLFAWLVIALHWSIGGFKSYEINLGKLFAYQDYEFELLFFVDSISLVYSGLVAFLANIIVIFSRYYLHREPGFRRYFSTILLFVTGINTLSLAGHFSMLFAGWELIGLSSFLLIGFFRDRSRPLINSLRVFAVYRFCDVGLLLGTLASNLLLFDADRFSVLSKMFGDQIFVPFDISHPHAALLISCLILLAACGKSAQFPFFNWLTRAFEGPTPSSAIFYGALSVHAGVFLLLRTQSIWIHFMGLRILISLIGFTTAIAATMIGRTQSNIKGQIAYAATTQVGIMFLELSIGLRNFVLLHMAANACLRCYQTLVSPSIVAHKLRAQIASPAITETAALQPSSFSSFRLRSLESFLPLNWRISLYTLALQGGFFHLSSPFWMSTYKSRGLYTSRSWLNKNLNIGIFIINLTGAILFFIDQIHLIDFSPNTEKFLSLAYGLFSLLLLFRAWSQIRQLKQAWVSIGLAVIAILISQALALAHVPISTTLYLISVSLFWCLGWLGISKAKPSPTLLFFSFTGLAGMPFCPTFVGEDLILHHLGLTHNYVQMLVLIIAFSLLGLVTAHAYAEYYRTTSSMK